MAQLACSLEAREVSPEALASPESRFRLPLLGVGIPALVLFAEGSGPIPLSAMLSETQALSQQCGSLVFGKEPGEMSPPQPQVDLEQRGGLGAGSTARPHRGCATARAAGPSGPVPEGCEPSLAPRLAVPLSSFPSWPRPVHHALPPAPPARPQLIVSTSFGNLLNSFLPFLLTFFIELIGVTSVLYNKKGIC